MRTVAIVTYIAAMDGAAAEAGSSREPLRLVYEEKTRQQRRDEDDHEEGERYGGELLLWIYAPTIFIDHAWPTRRGYPLLPVRPPSVSSLTRSLVLDEPWPTEEKRAFSTFYHGRDLLVLKRVIMRYKTTLLRRSRRLCDEELRIRSSYRAR